MSIFTKQRIDNLLEITPDDEKNENADTYAKMYFAVDDFGSAQHWASIYLQKNDSDPDLHKLLGQCYEELKQPDKALQAYDRSLQLDSNQPDLISEVCKLMLSDDSPLTVNPANVEIILKEIESNPLRPFQHARMLNYLIEVKRLKESFQHCCKIEMLRLDSFAASAEWYNAVYHVIKQTFKADDTMLDDWDFRSLHIVAIERKVYFAIAAIANLPNANKIEATNLLVEFDQAMYKFNSMMNVIKGVPNKELVRPFFDHYLGQLVLHTASVLYMIERVLNRPQWLEKYHTLILLSYQCDIADISAPWLRDSSEPNLLGTMQRLHQQGSFRRVETGRTLLACVELGKENTFLDRIQQICNERNWRETVYRSLFVTNDQAVNLDSSYLVQSKELAKPLYDLPLAVDLHSYEDVALCLAPFSLAMQVYLRLGLPTEPIRFDSSSFKFPNVK